MGLPQLPQLVTTKLSIHQYDKARPSYPASALHKIYASLPPPSNTSKGGLTILEPGSGTGIFTRLLLQPPDSTYPSFPISKLTAIEPSSGMRAAWQRGLEGKVDKRFLEGKKVWTVEGSFDDFSGVKGEIGEGEVDVVVIAQAWHWCPDHESALVGVIYERMWCETDLDLAIPLLFT
jgi:SAM-dependent methyltransferase